jgi:hypothetical protein
MIKRDGVRLLKNKKELQAPKKLCRVDNYFNVKIRTGFGGAEA